jgi:hypothetical protein
MGWATGPLPWAQGGLLPGQSPIRAFAKAKHNMTDAVIEEEEQRRRSILLTRVGTPAQQRERAAANRSKGFKGLRGSCRVFQGWFGRC